MSAPDALDLQAAADELGMHYDTLRKGWRRWSDPAHADFCGFPQPFRYPAFGRRGAVVFRASAIHEWKLARERALGEGRITPPTYRNAAAAADLAARRTPAVLKQRAALARMMERA